MSAKKSTPNVAVESAIKIIEASGAFDKKFYTRQLMRKRIKHKNPIEHYLVEGWKSGFDPHPCFDTVFYLEKNDDVRKINAHPFMHFVLYGHLEDRQTRADFSLSDYRKDHPDVDVKKINIFKHYTNTYAQTKPGEVKNIDASTTQDIKNQDLGNSDIVMKRALELGLFDLNWYNETYHNSFPTVSAAFQDYIHKSKFSPVNPSSNFDTETYHRMHSDVYHMQMSPLHHFIESGQHEGRVYRSSNIKWHPRTSLTIEPALSSKAAKLKVALCLHIYYEDYIDRFSHAIKDFPVAIDLFITVTDEIHEKKARSVFKRNKKVINLAIVRVPNKGRNFGPLLVEFSEKLYKYDLFCHLHSKKSLYSGREQTQWADYLTEYLIRDSSIVTKVLNAFAENPDFGLYYPATFWMMPSWVNHTTMNKSFMASWQKKLNLEESSDFISYPAGGMFWARPLALKGLLDQKYEYDFFPSEPLPNDGSMLHALERIVGGLAEKNGYSQFFYSPSSGKFTADQSYITACYQNNMENFKNQLRQFGTISFDVFDTLIRRTYSVPDYAKLLLGKELEQQNLVTSAQEFLNLRNVAEYNVRQRKNFIGDVGIASIYSEIAHVLKISDSRAQDLMRREFELDLGMIIAKDEMIDLFNELGSYGHVLWVISDTYYTREQVGLILRKAGVAAAYRLLVSSEEQKRKDNGTMWHMVKSDIEREKIESYIHVGDNVVADCQIPGDLGLTTMHILHPMDKWRALGLPELGKFQDSTDQDFIIKWGKLVSQIGRIPFI